MDILDPYGRYARAYPVCITIAPVVLALLPFIPDSWDWKLLLPPFILLPLYHLCKQIGGYRGKNLQSALWDKWGGPPTTRFLRHGNSEFNPIIRNRIHNKFRKSGYHVPSKEEQEQNPQEADDYYESCIKILINLTRNDKRFPLVFKGLKEYGFWRNIFALKPSGLTLALLSLSACLITVYHYWSTGTQLVLAIVYGVIIVGLTIVWLFWITEKAVSLAADRYANFLLEAALGLEVENGDDSLS